MEVPNYLTYFFREGQKLFEVLSDLDEQVAEKILKQDTQWRGDGTYLKHRKQHESLMREKFIVKGGEPKRQYPIYMILGDSPTGAHDMNNEYDFKLKIPIEVFTAKDISFTYPDSLYKMPINDLGRIFLERNQNPVIYCLDELKWVIEIYRVYEFNNHYVEAKVWNEEPLQSYTSTQHWQRCR